MNPPPSLYETLPIDAQQATLIGRAWLPGSTGGPTPVTVRDGELIDLSALAPTVSALLAMPDVAAAVRAAPHRAIGGLEEAQAAAHTTDKLHLLAPCDLQPIKAAGVTFAACMLERVIEEQTRGDAGRAQAVRQQVVVGGEDLSKVRPGSPQAPQWNHVLIAQGLWSQYLEVGIGPDAEIFTKTETLASMGTGSEVGLHPASGWNNPEPVLVRGIDRRARIVGASLGNDVNRRDC